MKLFLKGVAGVSIIGMVICGIKMFWVKKAYIKVA